MDLLYAIAQAIVTFMDGGPGIFTVAPLLLVVGLGTTLLHELGHAAAAEARLGEDVVVTVGGVGRIAELQLGRASVTVNAFGRLGGPAGVAEVDAARATARDVLAIALAGPAVSLVAALLSAWMLTATTDGLLHDVLWTATVLNVGGVLNLVPLRLQERRGGPMLRTDGRLALDALRVVRATR